MGAAGIKLKDELRCTPPPTRVHAVCVCVSDQHEFPEHSLHHSCHSFAPFFVHFLSPSHLVLISFFFSLPLAPSQKHAPIHPPTLTVGTGESPRSSTLWHGVMQRNTKIVAAPLPNGVSMATKGARPCVAA